MKKLFFGLALALATSTASAIDYESCISIAETSEVIARARDAGIPISETIKILTKGAPVETKKVFTDLAIDIYRNSKSPSATYIEYFSYCSEVK